MPEGLPGAREKSLSQTPLLTALARAFHWRDLFEVARFSSITDRALSLSLGPSHVRRIMDLALLGAGGVEAIVDGRETAGLRLAGLVTGMPVLWATQRQRIGLRSSVQERHPNETGSRAGDYDKKRYGGYPRRTRRPGRGGSQVGVDRAVESGREIAQPCRFTISLIQIGAKGEVQPLETP